MERYRRLAERVVGRRVARVEVLDPRVTRGRCSPAALAAALADREVRAVRRHGKLLLLDLVGGPTLGLRFGMTGTLVVDGEPGVDRLRHSPAARAERWVRFLVDFAGGGRLELHDPRRLGRVELDPDEGALGPDAATVSPAQLASALGAPPPGGRAGDRGRTAPPTRRRRPTGAPLKARLMDQSRLAGVGNLLADEVLWRAGLSPRRPAASLTPAEVRRLHRQLGRTLDDLLARGGSHTGDLMAERHAGGRCPKDGHELARAAVGGRTSWWCPAHQS